LPKATSLVEELRGGLGVESKLIKGGGGVFDVTVDGKLVYSKHETGRFPEPGEVLKLIEAP
jgi:selenoprotein W-related protein